MTKDDLKVGHVYSAKKSRKIGIFDQFWNDRQIIWLGENTLQYDSPAVKFGKVRPRIEIETFLAWANEDITHIMPKQEWRRVHHESNDNGRKRNRRKNN